MIIFEVIILKVKKGEYVTRKSYGNDIVFVVDGSKQTLVGGLPNRFFGHVILAFEELIGCYFSSFLPGKEKK